MAAVATAPPTADEASPSSIDDLRSALRESLQQRGVLGRVRAQLRSEIFHTIDAGADASPPRADPAASTLVVEELVREYLAFAGYGQAATMGEILRRCGDDLTRANVLKHATTLAGFHSPYFLDGINSSYTPDDYTPMKTLYISIFNGKDWDLAGEPMTE